jgi:hypothetical protein
MNQNSDGRCMSPDHQGELDDMLKEWLDAKTSELTSVSRRRSAEDRIVDLMRRTGVDVDSDVVIDRKNFSALISSRKKRNFSARSLPQFLSSLDDARGNEAFNAIKLSAYIHEDSISVMPDHALDWIKEHTEPSRQRKHFSVVSRD